MAASGKSVADLRQEFAIPTLRKNPTTESVDPIEQAIEFKKKMVGLRMTDQTVAEMDASAMEAENRRLKVQLEQRELKRQAEGDDNKKDSELQVFLLNKIEGLEKTLAEQQQAISEAQMNALREQLGILSAALERVQAQASQPVNRMSVLKQELEEAKTLVELVQPIQQPPPGADPSLAAWKMRAEFDQDRWKIDREDKHSERLEELKLTNEIAKSELALKQQHYEQTGRFFSDTGPKMVDALQEIIKQFLTKNGANVPPQVAGDVKPNIAATLPEGVVSLTCTKCGTTVYYRQGWPGVICNGCGALYTEGGDDPSKSASPDSGGQEPKGETRIA